MEKTKNSWYFYVCFFFVFSVIGWLCETGWFLYDWKKFVNRGFFYGPYLPIYGFGTTLAVICFKNIYDKKKYVGKLNIQPILIFVYSFVILSALEYVSSYVLEMIFDMQWWHYYNNKFNLHGRICLKNSIYFGIGGVLTMYFAYPLAKKIVSCVSENKIKLLAYVIVLIMGIDLVMSVIRYLG